MAKPIQIALLGTALLVASVPTLAGPYADDMAKCLVNSTTSEDKNALVQWMFAMMALHPDVKQLASVSDGQRSTLNRKMAAIMETLLTKSCLKQSREALKYEGPATIESSFNLLGQVAARELFANPNVVGGLADLGQLIDAEKLKKTLQGHAE